MELPEKKLSDAELDIMLAIWQSPPPVQRADLEEQLRSHNWADTTLLTLLSKLVEKGYLSVERQGRHNLYRPLVSEADYRRWANRSFLGKMYQSSLRRMVASLVESRDLTDRDLAELEEFIAGQRRAGLRPVLPLAGTHPRSRVSSSAVGRGLAGRGGKSPSTACSRRRVSRPGSRLPCSIMLMVVPPTLHSVPSCRWVRPSCRRSWRSLMPYIVFSPSRSRIGAGENLPSPWDSLS